MMKIEHFRALPKPTSQGSVKIETFQVNSMQAALTAFRREFVPEGDYTRLLINGRLIMSDTEKEFMDHLELFSHAKGDVLLNGLGLGCCLNVLAQLADVEHITVIENNQDVIDCVAPYFANENVTIINDDAFTWKPPRGKRYDTVWHDVWSDICLDNLEDMARLHRRYGKRAGWQQSWSRRELKSIQRRGCR